MIEPIPYSYDAMDRCFDTTKTLRFGRRLTPQFSGRAPPRVTWHIVDHGPLQLLVRRLTRRYVSPHYQKGSTADFASTNFPASSKRKPMSPTQTNPSFSNGSVPG